MQIINACVIHHFSNELYMLREAYFPGPANHKPDPFDQRSIYMTMQHMGNIIAAGRMTPNPDGPLITESQGKGHYRNKPDAIDMGRYLIIKDFQGIKGMYELLCLLVCDYAPGMGYRYGNAGVVAGSRLLYRLENIGFTVCGPATPMHTPNGSIPDVIPMRIDMMLQKEQITDDLASLIEAMRSKGLEIIKQY